MQDIYVDLEHHATANLWQVADDTWMLTGLEVWRSFRGQGHGARLLDRVLADADREGATIVLSVDPDGSLGSLDYDELTAFYTRRGFALVDESAMRREPRLVIAQAVEPATPASRPDGEGLAL